MRVTSLIKLLSAAAAVLVCFALTAPAQQVEVRTAFGNSVLQPGQRQLVPLQISLRGFELPDERRRSPVNVAIVLDRSGSMSGDKLARAKDAAIMAVERLRSDDILSLVTYDTVVRVVIPATKVLDRSYIIRAINDIQAEGNTALFAGVSQGGAEVQKFLDKDRLNRIVLISDGLANVGPSTPDELGQLGVSYGRQGISVTTIGLGLDYNEDLMTRLAGRSDGNHFFVQNSNDLVNAFNSEFRDILTAVARDVEIVITCTEGFRPVRVLGREAQIYGQKVVIPLNQVYARQEKYAVLEIEVPAGSSGQTLQAANVAVRYSNLQSGKSDSIERALNIAYNSSSEAVRHGADHGALEAYYTQLTLDNNSRAIALRDENKIAEAQQLLTSSASLLKEKAAEYNIPALKKSAEAYESQAGQMSADRDWKAARKGMSEYNYQNKFQVTK